MTVKVVIPTIKSIDHSRHVLWDNVICLGLRLDEYPCPVVASVANMIYHRDRVPDIGMWGVSFHVEVIHEQHHYSGDKLKFLKLSIYKQSDKFILSPENGAIFLQLANGKINFSQAIAAADLIAKTDDSEIPLF